jgi:hypothetical protein
LNVVFDLDGTILTRAPLVDGMPDYKNTTVKDRFVQLSHELKRRGHKIVIHTARGMRYFHGDAKACEQYWGDFVRQQLFDAGFMYDQLIFGKPAGDVYIDDKALQVQQIERDSYGDANTDAWFLEVCFDPDQVRR